MTRRALCGTERRKSLFSMPIGPLSIKLSELDDELPPPDDVVQRVSI